MVRVKYLKQRMKKINLRDLINSWKWRSKNYRMTLNEFICNGRENVMKCRYNLREERLKSRLHLPCKNNSSKASTRSYSKKNSLNWSRGSKLRESNQRKWIVKRTTFLRQFIKQRFNKSFSSRRSLILWRFNSWREGCKMIRRSAWE